MNLPLTAEARSQSTLRKELSQRSWILAAAIAIAAAGVVLLAIAVRQGLDQWGQYPTNGRHLGDMIAGSVAVIAVASALFQRSWRLVTRHRTTEPFVASNSWPRRIAGVGLPVFSVALWLVPLAEEWARSMMFKGRYLMLIGSAGGVLQVSDASGYYYDARRMLYDVPLLYSRRPLATTYLSSWLLFTGNHLQLTLLLNAILIGTACAIASSIAARRLGWPAAMLFWSVLFSFGFPVLATTLTEPVGFMLGVIGFGLLLTAATDRVAPAMYVGLLAAALGMDVRAGAFLVLPMLLVWVVIYSGDGWRTRLKHTALAAAAVGLALGISGGLLQLFGNGGYQGNFAYAFYGFVHGKPWTFAVQDNAQLYEKVRLRQLPESEFAKTLIQRSLQHLREKPSEAVTAYHDGLKTYFEKDAGGAFVFFTQPYAFIPHNDAIRKGTLGLAALGILWCLLSIRAPIAGLGLLAAAGIVVSAPFIVSLAGYRVFAASVSFEALLLALGLAWIAGHRIRSSWAPNIGALPYKALIAMCSLILLFGVVVPLLRKPFVHTVVAKDEPMTSTTVLCRPGTESPVLTVLAEPRGRLLTRDIRTADFVVDEGVIYSFPGLARNTTPDKSFQLIDALQLQPTGFGTQWYLLATNLDFPRDGREVLFHVQPGWDPEYGLPIRRVVSYEVPR